jgi:hypothetical protein
MFSPLDGQILPPAFQLEYYGVRGCVLKWFKSYLSDRKQRVYIKTNDDQDYFSTWEKVKQGVP